MSKKADDWAHKLMTKRPDNSNSVLEGFNKMFPIPEYEKLVFMSDEKEKQWNELPQDQKDFVMNNLRQHAASMQHGVAIDMLCNAINELNARIKKLEDNHNG